MCPTPEYTLDTPVGIARRMNWNKNKQNLNLIEYKIIFLEIKFKLIFFNKLLKFNSFNSKCMDINFF